MKRINLLLIGLLLLSLILVGCSNSKPVKEQSAEESVSNSVESTSEDKTKEVEEVSQIKKNTDVEVGADINKQDEEGKTVLIKAAKVDNIPTVKELLTKGANTDIHDDQGKTALIHAAYEGNLGVVDILLDYEADVSLKDNTGNRAIDYLTHYMEASKLASDNKVYKKLKAKSRIN